MAGRAGAPALEGQKGLTKRVFSDDNVRCVRESVGALPLHRSGSIAPVAAEATFGTCVEGLTK